VIDDPILTIFTESCLEQLENIEQSLLELEGANLSQAPEKVGRIFRAAHSIKGDAHSVGLSHISELAHDIESVLHRVREGSLAVSSHLITFLLQSFDHLRELVTDHRKEVSQHLREEFSRLGLVAGRPAIMSRNGSAEPLPFDEAGLREKPQYPAGICPDFQIDDLESISCCNEFENTPGVGAETFRSDNGMRQIRVATEQLDKVVDQLGELTVAQGRLMGLA
jgi:chemotaxis protein histidine kinase CheA